MLLPETDSPPCPDLLTGYLAVTTAEVAATAGELGLLTVTLAATFPPGAIVTGIAFLVTWYTALKVGDLTVQSASGKPCRDLELTFP